MARAAYYLIHPERRTTSVVFASPHSGREYPSSFLRRTALDGLAVRSSEDAFVDQLFDSAPHAGAPFLKAGVPRAFVDLAYVGYEAIRLTRAMADLYGGRPGAIGMIRLFRDVIAHLAVTGAIAAGDTLIQQVVGHGIAAKLSARLGEGVINGLMTARIGISAMDLCRPMPFNALKRPRIGDFLSVIASIAGADAKAKAAASETP